MVDKKNQTQDGFEMAKLFTWVKALETKINSLSREFELIKNETLRKNQDFKKDIKHVTAELIEVRHNQEKMQETIDLLIKEIKRTAGVEEVEVLKKYVEFWNPINFITENDLERFWEKKKDELKQHNK
jgi:hypothetical protein